MWHHHVWSLVFVSCWVVIHSRENVINVFRRPCKPQEGLSLGLSSGEQKASDLNNRPTVDDIPTTGGRPLLHCHALLFELLYQTLRLVIADILSVQASNRSIFLIRFYIRDTDELIRYVSIPINNDKQTSFKEPDTHDVLQHVFAWHLAEHWPLMPHYFSLCRPTSRRSKISKQLMEMQHQIWAPGQI